MAKAAACSFSLGTVNVTFFIRANHDLDILDEETGLFVNTNAF